MNKKEIIIQQLAVGGVAVANHRNVIYLSDADIARIIQVRYKFDHLTVDELVFALTLLERTGTVKQVPLEQVMKNERP